MCLSPNADLLRLRALSSLRDSLDKCVIVLLQDLRLLIPAERLGSGRKATTADQLDVEAVAALKHPDIRRVDWNQRARPS